VRQIKPTQLALGADVYLLTYLLTDLRDVSNVHQSATDGINQGVYKYN